MAEKIIYIGDDARFDFTAEQLASSGPVPVPLPDGTRLWSGVKRSLDDVDPPLITKRNYAAGGTEQQARVTDLNGGTFSVYLQDADTSTLIAGRNYFIDGIVELADGTRWTAGLQQFTARQRVYRTPA